MHANARGDRTSPGKIKDPISGVAQFEIEYRRRPPHATKD